jgi:predicted HTH domain antitoxin
MTDNKLKIKELLDNISEYSLFVPKNENEQIIKEAIELIRIQTCNFTDYSKILSKEIELKTYLLEENINPIDWKHDKGELHHTEIKVIQWLYKELQNIENTLVSDLLLNELELLNF